MDFTYDEAQRAVAELSRKIFTDRVTQPALREVEKDADRIHRSLWKDLADAGLLATAIPEEYGGSGHGLLALSALLVEAGAATAMVPLWPTLVLAALPIAEYGTADQKKHYLTRIASGEAMLTTALTEPGNYDALSPTTTAKKSGDGWVLDGKKTCVAAGHVAERILVPARIGEAEIGLFFVEPTAKGVTLARQTVTNDSIEAEVTLAGVHVAAGDVLVAGPKGIEALRFIVDRALATLCALELGVTTRALEMTAAYTASRQQFDRPIATFQAVAQRLADAYIDIEAIRLSAWRALWKLDQGQSARDEITVAKFWTSEGGHRVVLAAQHLHGGMGFDRDYPLHRYYTWSRHIDLTLGSGNEQLARLGAAMAG